MTQQSIISTRATNADGQAVIRLTGNTFLHRHVIGSHGGKWLPELKAWEMPYNPETETLAAQLTSDEMQAPKRGRGRPPGSKNKATLARMGEAGGFTAAAMQYDSDIRGDDDSHGEETDTASDGGASAQELLAAMQAFVAANAKGAKASMDIEQVRDVVASSLTHVYDKMDQFNAALELCVRAMNERPATRLEIRQGGETRTIEGLQHAKLPTLIRALGARLNVWLAGPSGSGKTHGAEQAAAALGLPFYLQGAMTMAHELTGFVDAGGKYHQTPFVKAFRDGGVILLDELDAGSNEALLALNAALANGIMCLPSGENIRANPNFRCIGAANTFGGGATAEYVGRTRIDAAFLQRFGARITWDYDAALEMAMSGNPKWCERVQAAREKARKVGLKVLITPRASIAGALLIADGFTPDEAAELTYLADLSADQRKMLGA